MPHKSDQVRAIELDLFIEAMARRHGYDFRNYAKASLRRRVAALATRLGCARIADLLPMVLHDDSLLPVVLSGLSVPVTRMFRNPPVFRGLREGLFPQLALLPEITIWQAGCASGEEVYSLAILLAEAGLLERTRILATDINDVVLERASAGVFPARVVDDHQAHFQEAGGMGQLSTHFTPTDLGLRVSDAIRDRITFSHHNLVSDGVFCRADLVVCRNVLIYFDRKLQDRVLGLFAQSLGDDGFLCLGNKENVVFSSAAPLFTAVDAGLRLYRKKPERKE
jgi:chemotaxis protein methyltransferase CheR